MERPVPPDSAVARKQRGRVGKALSPYLLALPGGLWLIILFVVPLIAMLSLSLQTGDVLHGYTLTWNFSEIPNQLSEHSTEFIRSAWYAGVATLICLVVSFPVAYWIAFYGGTRKNFFLLLLLLPFFVSFVIRSLAWQFILSDQGIVLGAAEEHRAAPGELPHPGHQHGGDRRHRVQLPAVHGAAAVRLAGAHRPAPRRGGR